MSRSPVYHACLESQLKTLRLGDFADCVSWGPDCLDCFLCFQSMAVWSRLYGWHFVDWCSEQSLPCITHVTVRLPYLIGLSNFSRRFDFSNHARNLTEGVWDKAQDDQKAEEEEATVEQEEDMEVQTSLRKPGRHYKDQVRLGNVLFHTPACAGVFIHGGPLHKIWPQHPHY